MQAMEQRGELLRSFGLRDRPAFEVHAARPDDGIWRVSVSAAGDPAIFMSVGSASRLCDVMRSVDPALAEQLAAAVEQARRYILQKP